MSTALLESAAELARLTGAIAMKHFRSAVAVETKTDGSPVTIADRGAEEAARAWLAKRFPRDGVLGEEFGERVGSSGRRWLIDPIDGTKTFVRGVPLWGSLIACMEGDDVLAGAAFFPAVDESLAAARGAGCWWNGSRASVSAVASLKDATVLTTDHRTFDSPARRNGWQALADGASIARSWGDCYGYLLVATGRAEAMVDARVAAWDAACFLPIIEEAGGVCTNLDGARSVLGPGFVGSNGALASQVRAYFI